MWLWCLDKARQQGPISYLLEWGVGSNNKAEIMALWSGILLIISIFPLFSFMETLNTQ